MNDLVHRVISGYHVAVRLLRHEVLDASPEQWRLAVDTLARLYFPPKDLVVRSWNWHGMPTESVSRKGGKEGAPPIVWIHGGGFAFCSPRTHRAAAGALAAITGREVWLPDYPLAPEQPFPAAHRALDHVPIEGPLDIVGDSAGGNLALSWALRRQNGDRLALLSPWVDLRVNGASSSNNVADHSAFDRDDLREYASLYLGGEAPTNPACSPVLADRASFAALGEVYIECAANELLNADAQLLASRMREAGVSLTTHEEARAHHGWQLLPDILPEAKQSAERLGQFLASP
jgi:monoterpene epsilon-lactone hydrolase